jgi:hypothetical protein
MKGWLQEDFTKGKPTQEQFNRALEELRAGAPEPQQADTRTPAQRELDRQFPPAKPTDYTVRLTPPGSETTLTPKMQHFEGMTRTWLAGAEFPKPLGDSLVSQVDQVLRTTGTMNDEQLEEYGVREFQKLRGIYHDKLEEKLGRVKQMVDVLEAKQPRLKRFLQTKGIGDSEMVASLLVQQTERWHARLG